VSNRFTRIPEGTVPPLPGPVRWLVPLADGFMVAMISRPTTGSLSRTWVTPATLWLAGATAPLALVLGLLLVAAGGLIPLVGAALLLLLCAGAAAVAVVGLAQRRSLGAA
jgi:hypothetical protein